MELPTTFSDPLLGRTLPTNDETGNDDAAVEALLKEVEDLRLELKISEALAITLAYKYAETNQTNLQGALLGLEKALQIAANQKELWQFATNYEEAVETILSRVNELNDCGEIDLAYANLSAEAARRKDNRDRQLAQDSRILDALIAQATLANDASGFADYNFERIQLEGVGLEAIFEYLHELSRQLIADGQKTGTIFTLASAANLARRCTQIAPVELAKAAAENSLALALKLLSQSMPNANGITFLDDAISAFRASLSRLTFHAHPIEWSWTMQNLAGAFLAKSTRTEGAVSSKSLAEAVGINRAILQACIEIGNLIDSSKAMHGLAVCLSVKANTEEAEARLELLNEAIAHYRGALNVITEKDFPKDWARIMQDLAGTLQSKGAETDGEEGRALLVEAAITYRAALRILNEFDDPVAWATITQNLGHALTAQIGRTSPSESSGLHTEAVSAYRAALRVFTVAEHPINWAVTMNNLGHALQKQGMSTLGDDRNIYLTEALEAFQAVLRVHSEFGSPEKREKTQGRIAELQSVIDQGDYLQEKR